MRTRRAVARPLIALAIAAALALPARALDLVDVWRAAATHDADFAAARAAHAAGVARRTQAGTLWRPGLTLEAGAGLATNDSATRGAQFSAPGFGQTAGVAFDTSVANGTSTRVVLALRQPLLSREREVQQRQLELGAEIADVQWHDAQQALMRRAAERYLDTVLADEQVRVLERQQAAVDRAHAEAQDRFRIGDRPVTDIHEAAARAAALTAQRLAAQTERALKRAALADLSGMSVDTAAMPLPGPPRPSAANSGPLESWLDEAARGNPGLRLAELQVRSAEQDARKTSAALSPSVDVVAQIGRERLSGNGDFGHASNTTSNRAIGVQLSVPLYTGGLRSARQTEARALIDKAGAELESMRRQAALQTRSAWLELSLGLARSTALDAALVASRARLAATRVGLRAGDRTTLDLLNAENDAAAAELAQLQARARLLVDELRLAALAGRLDEARLQQVNAALQPLP